LPVLQSSSHWITETAVTGAGKRGGPTCENKRRKQPTGNGGKDKPYNHQIVKTSQTPFRWG